MSRPLPAPACEHIRDGTRPHHSRGYCAACYHRAQYQPRRRAHPPRLPRGRLPADFDVRLLLALWGTSCPARYCACGRRIGPTCPVCEPNLDFLFDSTDLKAAAWAKAGLDAGNPGCYNGGAEPNRA